MSTEEQLSAEDYLKIKAAQEDMKKASEPTMTLDNAIADLKRQLHKESKNSLIRQWIGLYAQVIQTQKENEMLRTELRKLTTTKESAT